MEDMIFVSGNTVYFAHCVPMRRCTRKQTVNSEAYKCVGTQGTEYICILSINTENARLYNVSFRPIRSSSLCQPKRKAFIMRNVINTDLKIGYSFPRFTSII